MFVVQRKYEGFKWRDGFKFEGVGAYKRAVHNCDMNMKFHPGEEHRVVERKDKVAYAPAR